MGRRLGREGARDEARIEVLAMSDELARHDGREALERLRFAKKRVLLRRAEEAERQRDIARSELAAVYVALEKIGLAVRQHPAFEVLSDRTHP